MEPDGEGVDDVDLATVRDVLADHPVGLGVLFGSRVRTSGDHSDVDVAELLIVATSADVPDTNAGKFTLLEDLGECTDPGNPTPPTCYEHWREPPSRSSKPPQGI